MEIITPTESPERFTASLIKEMSCLQIAQEVQELFPGVLRGEVFDEQQLLSDTLIRNARPFSSNATHFIAVHVVLRAHQRAKQDTEDKKKQETFGTYIDPARSEQWVTNGFLAAKTSVNYYQRSRQADVQTDQNSPKSDQRRIQQVDPTTGVLITGEVFPRSLTLMMMRRTKGHAALINTVSLIN